MAKSKAPAKVAPKAKVSKAPEVLNPDTVTITAPNAPNEDVKEFHLSVYLPLVKDSIASSVVPAPAPNADGTYTVSLKDLTAKISVLYFGRKDFELRVAAKNSIGGESAETVATAKFTWQSVPEAPKAVSFVKPV